MKTYFIFLIICALLAHWVFIWRVSFSFLKSLAIHFMGMLFYIISLSFFNLDDKDSISFYIFPMIPILQSCIFLFFYGFKSFSVCWGFNAMTQFFVWLYLQSITDPIFPELFPLYLGMGTLMIFIFFSVIYLIFYSKHRYRFLFLVLLVILSAGFYFEDNVMGNRLLLFLLLLFFYIGDVWLYGGGLILCFVALIAKEIKVKG